MDYDQVIECLLANRDAYQHPQIKEQLVLARIVKISQLINSSDYPILVKINLQHRLHKKAQYLSIPEYLEPYQHNVSNYTYKQYLNLCYQIKGNKQTN